MPPLVSLEILRLAGWRWSRRRGSEGQSDAPQLCEHRQTAGFAVFHRHSWAKRGWHPARHPRHPLISLEIGSFWSGAAVSLDARTPITVKARRQFAPHYGLTGPGPAPKPQENKGWRKGGALSATLRLPATLVGMLALIVRRNHASCRMQQGLDPCPNARS